MISRHGEELLRVSVDALSPQGQSPVSERAIVLVDHSVLDHDTPFTDSTFAPVEIISIYLLD